jgi:hypothetical protein
MKHSDFILTDRELKLINDEIQRQITPGEQNDGIEIKMSWWVTGRTIEVSYSGHKWVEIE